MAWGKRERRETSSYHRDREGAKEKREVGLRLVRPAEKFNYETEGVPGAVYFQEKKTVADRVECVLCSTNVTFVPAYD